MQKEEDMDVADKIGGFIKEEVVLDPDGLSRRSTLRCSRASWTRWH